jgi:N-acetylglucosamine-6-phosphate deacetylase
MELKGIDIYDNQSVQLTIGKGRIIARNPIPAEGDLPFISPGFLDMQVNGYQGVDYSSEQLKAEAIEELVRNLAKSGTTRHIPTIITNPRERICRNLSVIAEAVKNNPLLKKAIAGIHVEGPFISIEDGPRGAHDAKYIRDPSIEELDAWIEASQGLLRMITIAPERKGAVPFIEAAVKRNVIVSIGHTAASKKDLELAVAAGASMSTHLGNGSHADLPRLRSYLWEQLANDGLWASIIADGFHLPESFLKVVHRVKGLDKIVLVSDVAPIGGYQPGNYSWGDIAVEVHEDGHVSLEGTPFLAGAGHLLNRCIAQFVNATGAHLSDAVKLTTDNCDLLLKHDKKVQGLAIGANADVTVFRWKAGDAALSVEETYLSGDRIA